VEWCSYFRLRDGQAFAQVDQDLHLEATASGYVAFPAATIQVSAQAQAQVRAYYLLSYPNEPEWLGFLGGITGQGHATGTKGRGHSAAILVGYNGHLYVLAFGTAHTIAKKLSIERRFGKTVVGNGKLPDEVRAVKAKVHGVAGKVRSERRGRGGPTRELEIPRQANMTSGIAAKVQLGSIEHVASGDQPVRTVAPVDNLDLFQKLDELEAWWNGGVELDPVLAALDRVLDVRDTATVSKLDAVRLAAIRAKDATKFTLCLDDEELWDAAQVEYIVNRQRLAMQFLDESTIFNALANVPNGVHPFDVRYEAVVPTRTTPVSGRLAENLAFETLLQGQADTFLYEDGGWFQANAQWKGQVTQDVQTLMNQSPLLLGGCALPAALNGRETEDAYIARVMATPPFTVSGHQMHRLFPPGQTQLELCDICVNGRLLLFVKRGSGRSACGDVTQQALDSANALVDSDTAFLTWANRELGTRGWNLDMANRSQLVFCIVLITGSPGRLPTTYTVRAMDALSFHLREIEKLGFRAAIAVV